MAVRTQAVAPAAVAGAVGALSAASLVLAWLNDADLTDFVEGNIGNNWLGGLAFGAVAALVLRVRPGNRLGRIFAASAVLLAACATGSGAATYTLRTAPGALPGADLIALCGVLWMPAFLLLLVGVPLLFPHGRLPSPRWPWPARIALAAGVVAVLAYATTEHAVDDGFPEATNPLDLPLPDPAQLEFGVAAFVVAVAVGVAAIAALVLRMRRLGRPERTQHAWFVASVARRQRHAPLGAGCRTLVHAGPGRGAGGTCMVVFREGAGTSVDAVLPVVTPS